MSPETLAKVQEALIEAHSTLVHARVFILTREKMHPTGVDLYVACAARVQDALALLSAEPEAGSVTAPKQSDFQAASFSQGARFNRGYNGD